MGFQSWSLIHSFEHSSLYYLSPITMVLSVVSPSPSLWTRLPPFPEPMDTLLQTPSYKSDEERDLARKKMFDSMDLKSTGVITFDEWYRFSMEHIAAKTAT